MTADLLTLSLLILIAFVPPVILAVRLRNAEAQRREPWRALLHAFLWGAVPAAFLSIALEVYLDGHLPEPPPVLTFIPLSTVVFPVSTVLFAPLIEEVAKALGLLRVRGEHPDPEDGYIYGGAIGLGFAATENVVYILSAFVVAGEAVAFQTALYRGIATVSLHGACSAIAGYGLWQARYGRRLKTGLAGMTLAIVLHMGYNALASQTLGWATLAAAGLAIVAYLLMMRRVSKLATPRGT